MGKILGNILSILNQDGSNVNQVPIVGTPVIDAITDTTFIVSCIVDPGSTPLTPALNWGTSTAYASTPVNATEGEISTATLCHFTVTGLTAFTNYFFKVVAGEVESAGGFTVPEELRDSSVVSFIKLNTQAGNFHTGVNTNTHILFDDSQAKALGANLMGAWGLGSGWSDVGGGAYRFNTSTSDGQISQTAGVIARGNIYAFEYELTEVNASGTLYTNFGLASSSLIRTVGTHTVYLIHNGANDTFTVRCNRSAAGAFTIRPISIKKVLGNHLYQTNDNYAAQYNGGAKFAWLTPANDYYLSFVTGALSCYVVAKKTTSDLDFKIYTDVSGLAQLTGGQLTLGGNSALSAFYDMTVKYVILRNTATISQNVIDYLNLINNIKALPRMIIPSNIYAVVGSELALYADQVCYGTDSNDTSPSEYTVQFVCAKGSTTGRKYAFTPSAGDVGTVAMTINAINKTTLQVVQTKTTTINVIAATAPAAVKDIVMLGDSLTDPGIMTEKLRDKFVALGSNVPLFKGAYGAVPNKHVGYSGNDIANFMGTSARRWKFYISGVTIAPTRYATYTNNSSTFQVMEIVLSGGAGYIKCNRTAGTNSPQASGTLTRASGTGDATITYSSGIDAPASPFFTDAGVFNFAEFKTNIGSANIGIFSVQLGANSSNTTELSEVNRAAWITHMKTMIDAILTNDANVKIIINLTSQDSHNPDGWGTTFPTNYQSKQNFRRNLRRLEELILDQFDNAGYHANVIVGISGLGLNRANPPFNADQFHPNADGSDQMALAQYPLILKLLQ